MKERLVGAAVLVALGVWLIPWVLDGPDDPVEPEEVALTLPVPGADDPLRSQTVVLDNDRDTPTPVPDNSADTETDTPTDPAVPESTAQAVPDMPAEPPPVPEPIAEVAAAPSAPEPESGWYIQAGAYEDVENARRQAQRVSALGFDAKVSAFTASGRTVQRVRIGPQRSRDNAESIASALSAHGFVVRVVSEE